MTHMVTPTAQELTRGTAHPPTAPNWRDPLIARTPKEWDEYIADAPTFAVAQYRIEAAVRAGADPGGMIAAQRQRLS